jgi:hypothetical protein
MDNAYFVFAENDITVERFHLCTWEFNNGSALMEIGCEILAESLQQNNGEIAITIYIPWINTTSLASDLYARLSDSVNSKFIFNDSVENTLSFDGGEKLLGVIHEFQLRSPLCILPIKFVSDHENKKIEIRINLTAYNNYPANGINIYFRFSLIPNIDLISIRKKGIGRSTIIYDVKVNERRNLPDYLFAEVQNKRLSKIKSCFCFHIVPNSYDLSFFDSSSLINVRTLEYESFNYYLKDTRIKKDELMVVFNKKNTPHSFAFFSIFSMERIGAGQFILAILINLLTGILLFIPSYRKEIHKNIISNDFWANLPPEVFIAILIVLLLIIYFIWPPLASSFRKQLLWIKSKAKKNK